MAFLEVWHLWVLAYGYLMSDNGVEITFRWSKLCTAHGSISE